LLKSFRAPSIPTGGSVQIDMQKLNGTRNFSAFAFVFSALTLHGCGATPAKSPMTLATTTTTTTPPRTVAATAAWLNNLFMGFDENDDDSPLGVTISMVHNRTLQDNLFCSALMNTTCYKGHSDCRTSAALYNHQVAVNKSRPHIFSLSKLGVGFVINPTRVQTDLGKCAYAHDGHTFWRLNGGCGALAITGRGGWHFSTCSNRSSAFYDVCPSTNKTCIADDVEIKGQTCSPGASGSIYVKPCFWSMPSLNYPGKLRPNHLREMVKARLKADRERPHLAWMNNEVVLDDRLLIPAMRSDPAAVVSAFVYLKSSHGSRSRAEGMRDRFSEDYSVGKIPVIGLDDTVDFTPKNGPFIVEENGGLEVIMV